MKTTVLNLVLLLTCATPVVAADNPIFTALTTKGAVMPTGAAVKLPAPIIADSMDAAAQTKAINDLLKSARKSPETFLALNSDAPVILKVKSDGEDPIVRSVDVAFIAHGKWDILMGEEFGNKIVKQRKAEANEKKENIISKSGFLTDKEIAGRKLELEPTEGRTERFFYTTFKLFDMVEVSATRHVMLTKTPTSALIAMKIDPRFAKDAEYPNQWRPINKNAQGNAVYGKPVEYSGAGLYVKATKLAEPANTVFIEYHSTYNEPKGWFDGENTLRSKMLTIAQHEAKEFRIKFAQASE